MIDVNSLIILHFINFFNQINNYKYIYLRERQQNPRKKKFLSCAVHAPTCKEGCHFEKASPTSFEL
jgi:hypothetical protein